MRIGFTLVQTEIQLTPVRTSFNGLWLEKGWEEQLLWTHSQNTFPKMELSSRHLEARSDFPLTLTQKHLKVQNEGGKSKYLFETLQTEKL